MSISRSVGLPTRTSSTAARTRLLVTAVVVVLAITFGVSAPANAAPTTPPATTAVAASQIAAGSAAATAPVVSSVKTFNSYGCVSLIGAAKNMYVAAFVLGYCPSVWVLQSTSWGRSFVNGIVNGACRVPWIVRAATGGRASSC